MKIKAIISASFLYLSIVSFNANASLMEADLNTIGDGLLTIDSSTQLEWLDVTATMFLSVNEILSGAGGWVDLGFRYATTNEVQVLAGSAGLTDFSGTGSVEQFAAASFFISLLGNTSGNIFNDGTAGRAGIGDFGPDTVNVPVIIASGAGTGIADIINNTGATVSSGSTSFSAGSYLVRDQISPVPLPAAFWLFGSFLLGLLGFSKYKT